MKVQKGFVSQKICDKTVLVRTAAKDGFCGIIELNDTAAEIWNCLEKGYNAQKTAEVLTKKYDVSYEEALKAVNDLSKKIVEFGLTNEE